MRTQKARVVIDPSWPTRAPREKPRSIAAEEELDTDTVLVVNETSTRRSTILAEVKFDVKLADLIIAPRKPLKRSDSEFEVIPHLKSVIVLDDIASNDFGIDEPWEHVFGDDDSDVKAPSYATVLASPK
ncbi:hypothetical protein C8J56DRAFT_804401 [Mycena floridula]|nr:hypothetical protein C8J56DRAFT_804401 [Mycena floridula]